MTNPIPAQMLEQLGQIKQFQVKPPREAPAGCWTDKDGRFVPMEDISEFDQLKEETLRPLALAVVSQYLGLADLKARLFEEFDALVETSWERYGVQVGGKKKNATVYLFDGSVKLERAFQNRVVFDERIGAAEALVREYLTDLGAGLEPEARNLIAAAFERNAQGEIRRGEMLRLRNHKISDERWQKAMKIIAEAEEIIDRACYITVSVRDALGKYQALPLDIASVRPHKRQEAACATA